MPELKYSIRRVSSDVVQTFHFQKENSPLEENPNRNKNPHPLFLSSN